MANISSPESVQRQFIQDSDLYMVDFGIWFGRLMTRLTKDEKEEAKLFRVNKFVEEFCETYNYFKEDYKKLEGLNLGKFNVIEVFHNCEEERVVLEVFPGSSLIPEGGKLTMIENYEQPKMIVEKGNEKKELNVDKNTIRKYLRFFVFEYGLFFDFLSSLRKKNTLGTIGDDSIFISCQTYDSDLDKIRIKLFGNRSWNIDYTFDICVDLLTGEIDYDNSTMQLNDYTVPILNNKIIDEIYNITIINRDNLLIKIKPLEEFFNKKRSEKHPFVDEEKTLYLEKETKRS